jgi:two-component system, response regulator RegA
MPKLSTMECAESAPPEVEARRSVLIIDDEDASGSRSGRVFADLGYKVTLTYDYATALVAAEQVHPSLILTELRVGGRWVFDLFDTFKTRIPTCRLAIVTSYPSVATAVHAIRLGFDAYVVKPVEVRNLLQLVDSDHEWAENNDACSWPSLDLTIWEYLNQTVVAAGSMSEAARRLRLDRRSLRRMLAKHPPSR